MRRVGLDANHAAIVRALRAAGCSVLSLAELGGGAPDLLVGVRGTANVLLEVKNPDAYLADGVTPAARWRKRSGKQERWRWKWRGAPVSVVRDVDEALRAVGVR